MVWSIFICTTIGRIEFGLDWSSGITFIYSIVLLGASLPLFRIAFSTPSSILPSVYLLIFAERLFASLRFSFLSASSVLTAEVNSTVGGASVQISFYSIVIYSMEL